MAKALGAAAGEMYTRGIGRPARWESRSTDLPQAPDHPSAAISWACIVASAILSLKK